jgi:hypothetical protein
MSEFEVTPESIAEFSRLLSEAGRNPADSGTLAKHSAPASDGDDPPKGIAPHLADRYADGSFAKVSSNDAAGARQELVKYADRLAADINNPQLAADKASREASLARVKATLRDHHGMDLDNPAPETRSPDQISFDGAFGPATSPAEYDLHEVVAEGSFADQSALQTARMLRASMFEMAVPRSLGGAFAEAIMQARSGYNEQPTPEAKLAYSHKQIAVACKVCGVQKEELFDAIRPVVAKLSEDNKFVMARDGTLESAQVLTKLYSIVRLAGRRPK